MVMDKLGPNSESLPSDCHVSRLLALLVRLNTWVVESLALVDLYQATARRVFTTLSAGINSAVDFGLPFNTRR